MLLLVISPAGWPGECKCFLDRGNSTKWNNPQLDRVGDPPNAFQTACFDGAFSNQPNVTGSTTVANSHVDR